MAVDPSAAEDPLDLERASQLLERLLAVNAEVSRAQAEAAELAARLAGSAAIAQLEGLPLELVLVLQSRLRDSDARMLITTGEVLAAMPVLAGLVRSGQVSWSVVREIAWQVRSFGRAVRGQIDQRLAATVHEHGGIEVFDPDRLVEAVAAAVRDARRAASVEQTEAREAARNFVAVQTRFDGGIRGHFELDAVTGAVVLNALDDAADAIATASDGGTADRAAADPDAAGGAGEHAALDADEPVHSPVTARGRQYGQALARIASGWLAGGGREGMAKPSLLVTVDLADVRVNTAGTVELNVRGVLPTLSLAVLEQLTTDATLRTVLFDGARPLAAAAKRGAATIPADTRLAVRLRDRGSRFPGDRDPIGWTDLHHIVHQADGGDHDPDNLLAVTRRSHRNVHDNGWTLTLDPRTAMVTASRRGRSYRSLPPGTPLTRPADTRPPGRAHRGRADRGRDRSVGDLDWLDDRTRTPHDEPLPPPPDEPPLAG
jgi:hypothetical protein